MEEDGDGDNSVYLCKHEDESRLASEIDFMTNCFESCIDPLIFGFANRTFRSAINQLLGFSQND